MQQVHYYTQLGWKKADFGFDPEPEPYDRIFYRASMEVAQEDRKAMFETGGR